MLRLQLCVQKADLSCVYHFLGPECNIPLSVKSLEMIKWRDKQGHEQEFRLADQVAHKWKYFGMNLDQNEKELHLLYVQNQNDPCKSFLSIMEQWLSKGGTRSYPATWNVLVDLLTDVDLPDVAYLLMRAIGLPIKGTTVCMGHFYKLIYSRDTACYCEY